MKRCALYCRVSTLDQNPQTQLSELRQFAANKGFQVVGEDVVGADECVSRKPTGGQD